MNDFQAIADRVEIEALRGEFTDAAMMRDRPRLASLFTSDGALRMPNIPAELIGREEIRAGASGCKASGTSSYRPHTPARSCSTATPRPAAPTSKNSRAPSTDARVSTTPSTMTVTSAPRRAGSSPSGCTRSGTSTPPRWRARRPGGVGFRTNPADATATPAPAASFADPASAERLERVAAALRAGGFAAEILDDAAAARARIKDLVPEGASVLTGASETLRLSGIEEDISSQAAGTTPSGRASWPSTVPPAPTRSEGWSPAPNSSSTASPRSPRPARSFLPRAAAANSLPTSAAPPTRSGSSARRRWCLT